MTDLAYLTEGFSSEVATVAFSTDSSFLPPPNHENKPPKLLFEGLSTAKTKRGYMRRAHDVRHKTTTFVPRSFRLLHTYLAGHTMRVKRLQSVRIDCNDPETQSKNVQTARVSPAEDSFVVTIALPSKPATSSW